MRDLVEGGTVEVIFVVNMDGGEIVGREGIEAVTGEAEAGGQRGRNNEDGEDGIDVNTRGLVGKEARRWLGVKGFGDGGREVEEGVNGISNVISDGISDQLGLKFWRMCTNRLP